MGMFHQRSDIWRFYLRRTVKNASYTANLKQNLIASWIGNRYDQYEHILRIATFLIVPIKPEVYVDIDHCI